MMSLLSLCLPGASGTPECIEAPSDIPTGGLFGPGQTIIQNGIVILSIVAIILTLVFLLFNAIKWITSSGDKQKIAAARSGIIYAIVGLVIVFLAFLVINVIGYFFNIN